ncbi:MAG: hypothetical protein FRX48_02372 [Lasallia pustulata]|uniref:FAD-binding FR-type domain-containing protein n=1 Tax=Lasallia pustulata TaxID=136370 RepID=A0A5M8PZ94_9LECA|nr:MAG: hypothetical protein FRX48_02372 [Lasallia pustulata]
MLPRHFTWMLERYLGLGSIARPSQPVPVIGAFTTCIPAFKNQARLLSTVNTSGSRQPRWPWYLLTFVSGFGSAAAYKFFTEPVPDPPLNPQTFSPYTLVSKGQISSTASIFTLRPSHSVALKDGAKIYNQAWKRGIWSVEVKQPQLQIARAYTPLPPSDLLPKGVEDDRIGLRFFIRRDPKGEVSGYLHKLPEGATIDLRGPHLEYKIPNNVGEILFLAGGTGIAPALQAAHTLLSHRSCLPTGLPKIRILWANRRRDDCKGGMSYQNSAASGASKLLGLWPGHAQPKATPPQNESLEYAGGTPPTPLVKELMALQKEYPSNIRVEYFVDEESTYIGKARLDQCINDKSSWTCPSGREPGAPGEANTGRKLILVSGPDGFVEYLAGQKVWDNGKEGQGRIGGLLSMLDLKGWEVWKL